MNDINSLPPVPTHVIDAMQREADKKFGKVPGLDEQPVVQPKLNPMLQQHEEPVFQEVQETVDQEPTNYPENPEPQSEISGEDEEVDLREVKKRVVEAEQVTNFRAMKRKAEAAERERDEALKLLKKLAAQQEALKPEPQEPEEVDTFGMNPDDLVEGKHLSKVAREIKALKQQLDAAQNQNYMSTTEARLKAQFPDLDKVLTPDNIETFKYAYPELASTIDSTKDIYTKAVSAYTMIKKFGVYQEPGFNAEKEIAKKNAAKPRPLASVAPQQGDSPMSRANAFANGLTKELQEQMWKEMSQARKDY
jgi:hypothetical protein